MNARKPAFDLAQGRPASGVDAGLIVAGAYGHTRFGEWMFGGVTRHLLKRSRRPVLVSH